MPDMVIYLTTSVNMAGYQTTLIQSVVIMEHGHQYQDVLQVR